MTDSASSVTSSELASFAKGVWWLVLLRGILAVVFGIIALLAPVAALTGVAIVYGAYTFVDGAFTIVHAVRERSKLKAWGWLLFQGIVAVIAGLLIMILPIVTGIFGGLVVLWTIVIWNVIHGIAGLRSAAGAEGGKEKTWGIIAGIASILLAIVIAVLTITNPLATVFSLIWVVGIWAVIFGIMLVIMAIQVRVAWNKSGAKAGAAKTA